MIHTFHNIMKPKIFKLQLPQNRIKKFNVQNIISTIVLFFKVSKNKFLKFQEPKFSPSDTVCQMLYFYITVFLPLWSYKKCNKTHT